MFLKDEKQKWKVIYRNTSTLVYRSYLVTQQFFQNNWIALASADEWSDVGTKEKLQESATINQQAWTSGGSTEITLVVVEYKQMFIPRM